MPFIIFNRNRFCNTASNKFHLCQDIQSSISLFFILKSTGLSILLEMLQIIQIDVVYFTTKIYKVQEQKSCLYQIQSNSLETYCFRLYFLKNHVLHFSLSSGKNESFFYSQYPNMMYENCIRGKQNIPYQDFIVV